MVASLNGNVEVVDKLIQQGATVDLQTKVCVMPLTHKNKCFKMKYPATQMQALYFPNVVHFIQKFAREFPHEIYNVDAEKAGHYHS